MYCSSEKRGDGSSDASNALHGWPSRSHGQNRLLWSSNPMLLFEAPALLSHTPTEERACSNSAPTSPVASPSLTRQRRPAPSASSLLHFSSPSPAPSPAARAQKQSRTREAADSAATRCRLLEASKSPTPSQASHAYPPG